MGDRSGRRQPWGALPAWMAGPRGYAILAALLLLGGVLAGTLYLGPSSGPLDPSQAGSEDSTSAGTDGGTAFTLAGQASPEAAGEGDKPAAAQTGEAGGEAAGEGEKPTAYQAAAAQANDISREADFTRTYRTNGWGDSESRSGGGSTLRSTKNIRRLMGLVLRAYGVASLLDIPCGDCHWQNLIPGFNGTSYLGIDIVNDAVEANKEKYARWSNMRFLHSDVVAKPVPPGTYDLVLCRDLIQHLTLADGVEAYRHIEESGAKYLLTNFHSEAVTNTDIRTGDCRYLDPMLPPFNFSRPLLYAVEHDWQGAPTASGRLNQKVIGLWKLPALGRGDGTSVTPIVDASLEGKIVVLDKDTRQRLEGLGHTDLVCHSDNSC